MDRQSGPVGHLLGLLGAGGQREAVCGAAADAAPRNKPLIPVGLRRG